jgi:hypothetical protein
MFACDGALANAAHGLAIFVSSLMRCVWKAMALLHKYIVHLDLYASNIMWRRELLPGGTVEYAVRIIDWDTVHALGARLAPRLAAMTHGKHPAIIVVGAAAMPHAVVERDRRTLAVWAWAAVYGSDALRAMLQSVDPMVLNEGHHKACAGTERRSCVEGRWAWLSLSPHQICFSVAKTTTWSRLRFSTRCGKSWPPSSSSQQRPARHSTTLCQTWWWRRAARARRSVTWGAGASPGLSL